MKTNAYHPLKKEQLWTFALAFILLIFTALFALPTIAQENVLSPKIHPDLQKIIDAHKATRSPDEPITVLIQVQDRRSLSDISSIITQKRRSNIARSYALGNVVVAEVSVVQLEEIAQDSKVKEIWPNRVYYATLDRSVPQIKAPDMWAQGYNGSGMKIAILDTGIDASHAMFGGRVVQQEVFTGEPSPQDVFGHGTHVAGIAAGNGLYKGVAPGALLMNGKVLSDEGSGTDAGIIAGINWAVDPDGNPSTDDGADIISMSLGGNYRDLNSPIVQAVEDAILQGVVVVVASGNCGGVCPSSTCNGYVGIATPGITPSAITVGAVDDNDGWACFSSGEDIPGVGVKPDVAAPGVSIMSSTPGGGYVDASGTSMATPHVAGAAALLLQSNPQLTPEQVKFVMEQTAVPLGDPGKDVKFGSGRIDASNFIPPSVNQVLKYRLQYKTEVYPQDPLYILLNTTSTDVLNADAVIGVPDGTPFTLPLENISTHSWRAIFYNTSSLGVYSLNVTLTNQLGEHSNFTKAFSVRPYNLTLARISQLTIPQQIPYNATLPIAVLFENNENLSLATLVEVQVWQSGRLVTSIESNYRNVTPHSNETFLLSWDAITFPGDIHLVIIATFGGQSHVKEWYTTIVDDAPPQVLSVTAQSTLHEDNPFVFTADLFDVSSVSGSLAVTTPLGDMQTIPLIERRRINAEALVTGAFFNTTALGTYTFTANVCDSVGHCTAAASGSFEVESCGGASKVLVVSEEVSGNNTQRYTLALGAQYCMSLWDPFIAGIPNLEYLRRFDVVVWSSENYFTPKVDDASAALLEEYVAAGKSRLLVEGADIALRHVQDTFMQNVVHAKLSMDLFFLNDTSIAPDYHPLFKQIPIPLPYASAQSPYPDAIIPVSNGSSIAWWGNTNFSAGVVYEGFLYGRDTKTAFFPFLLSALGAQEQTVIKNSVAWLLAPEDSTDVSIINSLYPYPTEGDVPFTFYLNNSGTQDAAGVAFDVYIDGQFYQRVQADVPSMVVPPTPLPTFSVTLPLTSGNHQLKVIANADYGIMERNYLNNVFSQSITVATVEADLAVESLMLSNDSYSFLARVSNKGGTYAEFPLDLYLNGELYASSTASALLPGQASTFIFGAPSETGIYTVRVVANPSHVVIESDYTNNELQTTLYKCSKARVIIVADDDAPTYSTESPQSAEIMEQILKEDGYCTTLWSESESGVPSSTTLDTYDAVIWSAGDYWGGTLNTEDAALLSAYNGSVLFEGSDLAFDHASDGVAEMLLHAAFDRDFVLADNASVTFAANEITNLTSLTLASALSPYPDGVLPANGGYGVGIWDDDSSSYAFVAFNDTLRRSAYLSFSLDAIQNTNDRSTFLLDVVSWLVQNSASACDADGDSYDRNDYGYGPCAGLDCDDTNPGINPSTGFCVERTITKQLRPGWNSVSLELAEGVRPSELLANNIAGNCTNVAAWDGSSWRMFQKGLPLNNNPINPAKGYFVLCMESTNLTITGMMNPSRYQPLSLNPGWNFVSMSYLDINFTINGTTNAADFSAWLLSGHPEYSKVYMAMWGGNTWKIYFSNLPLNKFVLRNDSAYVIRADILQTRSARAVEDIPSFDR
ncbi:S8 family serine peptidase [Candidatus Woesearchaeota archaeon]|nr:S8 family serine peptidase [Candidatus Woesearchaeota archaeon]